MSSLDRQFLIPLNLDQVKFETWLDLYQIVRKEHLGRRFGYGIEIKVTDPALDAFPSIRALTEKYDFVDQFYFLITHAKTNIFPIHIDGEINSAHAASVNWPILNCTAESKTKWYEVPDPKFTNIDGSYFLDENCKANELYSASMLSNPEQAYLFRSDIWHSGHCGLKGNKKRVMVKWMLKAKTWDLAYEQFHNQSL